MTNIIVAFQKPEDGKNIKKILVKNGFAVTALCTLGSQVLSMSGNLQGGIVVSGFSLGDMKCGEMEELLSDRFELLVIASPSRLSGQDLGKAVSLSTPFKTFELIGAVRKLEAVWLDKKRSRKKIPPKRSKEEKKLISRAKELLMERNGMTEEAAHRYLQQRSMESGNGLFEAAGMVLSLYS